MDEQIESRQELVVVPCACIPASRQALVEEAAKGED
jgi:hypothetical protein